MSSGVALSVTVWSEGLEQQAPEANRVYPDGMHEAIAAALRAELGEAALVRTATLDDSEHGLSSDVLEATDVLAWWGHRAHGAVDDAVADCVVQQCWTVWASSSCTRATSRSPFFA